MSINVPDIRSTETALQAKLSARSGASYRATLTMRMREIPQAPAGCLRLADACERWVCEPAIALFSAMGEVAWSLFPAGIA
jgi:hypothetical protein